MVDNQDTRLESLRKKLVEKIPENLEQWLEDIHPADLAELLAQLPEDRAAEVFVALEEELAVDVLAEADEELIALLTSKLPVQEISDLLDEMEPDDAADVVGEIEDRSRARLVLEMMGDEERGEVQRLLQHDEESAGGIMTSEYLAFPQTWTVAQTIEFLRSSPPEVVFSNAFTLDHRGRLEGVFPLQNLLWSKPETSLLDLAEPDAVRVTVETDQEEVARLFTKYDLYSIPVVDKHGFLTGRITVDDVLDVVQEETSEDMFRLAGSSEDELLSRSALTSSHLRLPWMLIAMCGGIGCSLILRGFESQLAKWTFLVFYIPVITAMGGNIATQSSTLMVRGLATGQIDLRRIWPTILKEIRVGLMMGLVCGILAGLFSSLMGILSQAPAQIGLIVGTAMFISMTSGTLMGSMIPTTLSKLGVDPAVASGPFLSMSNDLMGLMIYLTVARTLSAFLL